MIRETGERQVNETAKSPGRQFYLKEGQNNIVGWSHRVLVPRTTTMRENVLTMHAMPPLTEDVLMVVTRYLALADETLPDRVEGLYLVGSLALNDYQEGQSDIDFVALTGSPLSAGELDRAEAIHRALLTEIGRPPFDGIYITRSDLAHNPDDVEQAPHVLEGRFHRDRGFEVNPITWLTLRTHLLPVRGPVPAVWSDPALVRRWTLANLNSYWAGMVTQLERATSTLSEVAMPRAILWCVSGVLRLAYTLDTGDVTSKSGACRYALAAYPEQWHPIASRALAIRTGTVGPEATSRTNIDETIAFMRFVIERENTQHAE
jgi:aminoglycoside adenylyltransferase-like protein/nucleotidyltransferase-like protein